MRSVSRKRSALNRSVELIRNDYRAAHPRCQWCDAVATDLHEIAAGPAREAALAERCAWLHLCRLCHEYMKVLPIAGQLAIKSIADPFCYDRRRVNVLRGREPDAVTQAEVDVWWARLTMGR